MSSNASAAQNPSIFYEFNGTSFSNIQNYGNESLDSVNRQGTVNLLDDRIEFDSSNALFEFDSSTDVVDPLKDSSFVIVFNVSQFTGNNFLANLDEEDINLFWQMNNNGNQKIQFSTQGTSLNLISSSSINTGEIYCTAATYSEEDKIELYSNTSGTFQLDDQASLSNAAYSNPGTNVLGNKFDGSKPGDWGSIYRFKAFKGVLSGSELKKSCNIKDVQLKKPSVNANSPEPNEVVYGNNDSGGADVEFNWNASANSGVLNNASLYTNASGSLSKVKTFTSSSSSDSFSFTQNFNKGTYKYYFEAFNDKDLGARTSNRTFTVESVFDKDSIVLDNNGQWQTFSSLTDSTIQEGNIKISTNINDPAKGFYNSSTYSKTGFTANSLNVSYNLSQSLDLYRKQQNSTIIPYNGSRYNNANLLYVEGDNKPFKLFTGNFGTTYESKNFSYNFNDWSVYDTNVPDIDDIIKCKGEYYLFSNTGDIYSNDKPKNWQDTGTDSPSGINDAGYYCENNQTFHAVSEAGSSTHDFSSQKAKHYTSPDGLSWTAQSTIIDQSNTKYGVGDFDPVKLDGRRCMLYDNSTGNHPDYFTGYACSTGDSWDSEFKFIRNVVEPRRNGGNYGDNYGVNDPDFAFANGRAYVVLHGHPNTSDFPYGGIHGYEMEKPSAEYRISNSQNDSGLFNLASSFTTSDYHLGSKVEQQDGVKTLSDSYSDSVDFDVRFSTVSRPLEKDARSFIDSAVISNESFSSEPPSITIDNPTGGATLTNSSVDLEAFASVDSTFQYNVDGSSNISVSDTGSDLNETISGLSDGGHTLNIFATDSNGNTGSDSVSFTVDTNSAPAAAVTKNVSNPKTLEVIEFDASGSADTDGSISSYTWDLNNDGSFGDSTGVTAQKSYSDNTPSGSVENVSVKVTDNDGLTDTNSITFSVANRQPSASFTTSTSNLTVDVDASGSSDQDGSISTYEYDWTNDGTFDATGQTASKTYNFAGSYNVKLRVTDDDGATSTSLSTVDVSDGTSGGGGDTDPGPTKVAFTLDNVGSSAWVVENDSTNVADDSENPDINLEQGKRYTIRNNGYGTYGTHPLAFFDADGNTLLSQSSTGSFEDDSDVNWVDNGETISFTVTQELYNELSGYRCTVHGAMEGNIVQESSGGTGGGGGGGSTSDDDDSTLSATNSGNQTNSTGLFGDGVAENLPVGSNAGIGLLVILALLALPAYRLLS